MGKTFFLFLSTLVLSTNILSSQTAEKYFEMVKQVYPNYEKAAYLLTKAIYKDPKNADYHLARAKIRIMSGLKESEIKRDFGKAITLDPSNPYIYVWMAYYGYKKMDKSYMAYIEEAYTQGKNKPEVLSFYVNQISLNRNTFKFKNNDEIAKIFQNGPKSYRSIISQIRFLELDNKQQQADDLISILKTFSYSKLSEDYIKNQEINKNGIPSIEAKISSSKFDLDNRYALLARQHDEEFEQYKFQRIAFLKQLQGRWPPPAVSSFHIEALFKVGRYQDTIRHSRKPSIAIAHMNSLWEAKALGKMGLHKESANRLEPIIKKDSYISKSTFNYIKELVKDQQFTKALKLAKLLKFKEDDQHTRSMLLCTYYLTTNQFGAWEENYKKIKKFHGSSNYQEMMYQVNRVRTTCGNPHLNIYEKVKEKQAKNALEILYTQANSAISQNKLDQAQKWLNEAKRIDPNDCRNIFQEAKFLFKTGETKKALEVINTFLSQAALDEAGILLKGMIQLELKQFKEAYATFGTLANKRTAAYYRLIPLFCLGKYDIVEKSCKTLIQKDVDIKVYVLLHMIQEIKNKDKADEMLKKNKGKLLTASAITYSEYKLGLDSLKEYKKQMDYGPLLSVKFNFTLGFEAMQKGEKEKAIEHFKKCLIPYSIDLPEYHMAKACLKELK